jgi:hypothetical protein
MGAARASTAGHWELAFNAMSEAQMAYAAGRGAMGFAFFTASFGTIPFFSLFLAYHFLLWVFAQPLSYNHGWAFRHLAGDLPHLALLTTPLPKPPRKPPELSSVRHVLPPLILVSAREGVLTL